MKSTRSALIVLVVTTGLYVWFFADALFGGGVFAFRDAGHYYYPLFEFIRGEWAAKRVPLWNPYENLGVPLAGNPTSSVFYPGAIIFLLPLDFAWAYKLYVMGHVLLAAGTAYRLARYWGASIEAAGAAAISYAFSGNVLFQYCNVVFLVGAAWLPLALLAAERMLAEGSGFRRQGSGSRRGDTPDAVCQHIAVRSGALARLRAALAFGAVLALMTLGGNAEMAYHAVLVAAMYALWLWWGESATKRDLRPPLPLGEGGGEGMKPHQPLAARLARSRPVLLIVAAAAGLMLSAAQVFPALELSRQSGRSASSVPRTVYELPKHLLGRKKAAGGLGPGWADGLLCRRLDPATHHEHVYHFSVGPWRLAEYLWPNFSGRQFPLHRRWIEVIPAEGRVWVPSLYMGLFPFFLAVAAMRLRRGSARENWLSWLAVLSIAASFGWYGLGWLAHEVRIAAGHEPAGPWMIGSPVGGLYWLLTVLLPGYIHFRYPAKWLVIAALALSMLAAGGWDGALAGPSARLRRGLLVLGGVSLAGAAVALVLFSLRERWLASVEPDVLFGPLDKTGACLDLLRAFLHTAVLSAAGWWLLRLAARGVRWVGAFALVLVAVDLGAANGWMVACAPARQWQTRPKAAAVFKDDEAKRGVQGPCRVYRHPIWMPPSWSAAGSPSRLAQGLEWDRDTLFPKHNLRERIPLVEVDGTMSPYAYQMVLWLGRKKGWGKSAPAPFAAYVIAPATQQAAGMERIDLRGTLAEGLDDVSLWRNPAALPRVWVVEAPEVLEPLDSNDPHEVWQRTEEVFYPDGRPRDLRVSAVVEGECGRGKGEQTDFLPPSARPAQPGNASVVFSPCRIVRDEPSCVEIEVNLARPGLVVLCDQFYPGWRLEVQTGSQRPRELPILRTNRVMRGAWLPAGQQHLTFRYCPASFVWGIWLSGIGWLAAATIGLASMCGGKSHKKEQPHHFPA